MRTAFDSGLLVEKQEEVKCAVEVAYAVIAEQYAQEMAGKISREEAQERAKKTIRSMRYGGEGYLWINDFDRVMIMDPIKPELEGKDLTEFKDTAGRRIFLDFVDEARKGSGFVAYLWPKPGQSEPAKKVSYVKGFAPWGWLLGTGLYVDDVETAVGHTWVNALRNGKLIPVVALAMLLLAGSLIVLVKKGKNLTPVEKTLGFCLTGILPFLVLLGGITLVSAGSMKTAFHDALMHCRQDRVSNLVQIASAVVDEQYALEVAGKISRAEAQECVKKTIRNMRYGNGGKEYFWMNRFDGIEVMHPVRPDLEGTSVLGIEDPNGKKLYVEIIREAREHGSGFVDYMWPKPGAKSAGSDHRADAVPKVSFVKGFPAWGWVLGTGLYVDDVDAAAGQQWLAAVQASRLTAMVVLGLTLLVGGVVLFAPIF